MVNLYPLNIMQYVKITMFDQYRILKVCKISLLYNIITSPNAKLIHLMHQGQLRKYYM